MFVKALLLLIFARHLKVSINFIIQFQECLLSFIIETIHTNLNNLCLVTKDIVCLDNVNQAAGTDDLFDTTIIEGLTDNVCPVSKTLAEVRIITQFVENLNFNRRGGVLLLKGHRKTLKERFIENIGANESDPSSEPLPLVLAVAKIWNPLAGTTNLPIFFRKTPLPSRMDCRHRILLDARSISSSSSTAPRWSASTTGSRCAIQSHH